MFSGLVIAYACEESEKKVVLRLKKEAPMSQQHEMEFADLHVDQPEASYRGYRDPSYEEYQDRPYQAAELGERVRISANPTVQPDYNDGINPTFLMQMRLGLIIVSLLLWVIVFFGSIWA